MRSNSCRRVPKMFGYYYPDAAAVLADPTGASIIADGRNHLELTTERFDIIVTDPPPPIESSGCRGHLVAGVLRGRAGPPDRRRGDDAVGPYGDADVDSWTTSVLRDRVPVRPRCEVGRRLGLFMLGSGPPVDLDEASVRGARRPGVSTTCRRRTTRRPRPSRAGSPDRGPDLAVRGEVRAAGPGPLITDDAHAPSTSCSSIAGIGSG